MLRVSQLEVGTLATFLRLALGRKVTFPIPMDQFRNGALGQHWINSARNWRSGDRVIDVGCGYSDLPSQLAKAGCEVWGADDFGLKSGDTYWLRGKHPHDLAKQFPDVRYVFERLGDQPSSFPDDYFDVVISNQALHVAKPPHAPIWRDMLRVMKKSAGSEMLISMICNFGTDGSPDQAIDRLSSIREMERNILGRLSAGEALAISEFETLQEKAGQSFHRFSPALYAAYVATALGAEPFVMPEELLAENYCTRVNSLIDPTSVGFNNARFGNNPDEVKGFRYGRYAPILMRLSIDSESREKSQSNGELMEFENWSPINSRLEKAPSTFRNEINSSDTHEFFHLVEDQEDATHMLASELGIAADIPFKFSVFVKPNGRDYFGMWLRGPNSSDDLVEVFFDLRSGTVAEASRQGAAILHDCEARALGGGWICCSVQATPSQKAGFARVNLLIRKDLKGSSKYLGDGKSALFISTPSIHSIGLAQ
jgi:SAM-dependent methyltransferase